MNESNMETYLEYERLHQDRTERENTVKKHHLPSLIAFDILEKIKDTAGLQYHEVLALEYAISILKGELDD